MLPAAERCRSASGADLRMRFEPQAGATDASDPVTLSAYQVAAAAEAPTVFSSEIRVDRSRLDIATIRLNNPLSPVLLAVRNDQDEILFMDLVPFPSLCRRGFHYPELRALATLGNDLYDLRRISAAFLQSFLDRGNASPHTIGAIRIDGSSTVEPFAQAAVELFSAQAPNVRVTVGGSGTGDGFERFCNGETDISNASRPIEEEEAQACEQRGVQYEELTVANDGIAVVHNPETQFPECVTFQQLRRLLRPNSNVSNYSALGDGFPDTEVSLFTPGTESGTYDYFTEEVLETDAEQRTENIQTSANDNQLITGIEGTQGGLGYVGFSYAEEEQDRLAIFQVDDGESGCVAPSTETIQANEYPISRPIFMYPKREALQRPEVRAFMEFVVQNHQQIAEASRIVPMNQQQALESQQEFQSLAG
jgi:phosphate transport system substrate-binding protein